MQDNNRKYIRHKIELRRKAAMEIGKKELRILDAYAGKGVMWREVKKQLPLKVNILSIEKEKGKNIAALEGDNMKYLKSLDLTKFDIIDLDAYSVPFEQLKTIIERGFRGIVIVTCIDSMIGTSPIELMRSVGITDDMRKECPSIFSNNSIVYLQNYLYLCKIKKTKGYFFDTHNYFYFKI